ncbi:MAG: TMEM198/TM7SF3 family protein [Patescibacteria group bacterium]|jgi:hypothetical protein|nr:TMEM198/TM7SF3 family protein [Patescibacteria group bacterium]
MDILFGILAIGIGGLILISGYRLARIVLPLWGFFAGFTLGAAGAADAFGEAFLGTSMGIFIGLIIGVVFAIFAYFFYSLAVVLLGASAGYWLGTSFMALIGLDKGFLSAVVGISLGVVFALLTIGFNAAKYLLIGLTSLAGAVVLVNGIMLVFNQVNLSSFDYITATEAVKNSWIWVTTTVVLFIFGFATQYIANKDYYLDSWTTEYGAPKNNNDTYNKE